jgi:COMPASS component SWD1
MNLALTVPSTVDYPERVEQSLEYGYATTSCFNRKGNILAVGCNAGLMVLWDFQSRSVVKYMRQKAPEGDDRPMPEQKTSKRNKITSVSMSRNSRYLCSSSATRLVNIWDILSGECFHIESFAESVTAACIDPAYCHSGTGQAMFLATTVAGVFLCQTGQPRVHLQVPDSAQSQEDADKKQQSPEQITQATFSASGDQIFTGTSRGRLLIFQVSRKGTEQVQITPVRLTYCDRFSPEYATHEDQAPALAANVGFSWNKSFCLGISASHCERYILLNLKSARGGKLCALELLPHSEDGEETVYQVTLSSVFQDVVNRLQWNSACFSNNNEYVCASGEDLNIYSINIWNRLTGQLVKVLEAPKEMILNLAYHPTKPIISQTSTSGCIYIWTRHTVEDWSTFATDFRPLAENTEYIEAENEFDYKEPPKAALASEEEAFVDVLTLDKPMQKTDNGFRLTEANIHPGEEPELETLPCTPGIDAEFVKLWKQKQAERSNMQSQMKVFDSEQQEEQHKLRAFQSKKLKQQQQRQQHQQELEGKQAQGGDVQMVNPFYKSSTIAADVSASTPTATEEVRTVATKVDSTEPSGSPQKKARLN